MTSLLSKISALLTWTQRHGVLLSSTLLLVVTVLSLFPADKLPPFPGTDKTHHFIAYAAVMLPITLKYPRYWWLIGVLVITYSGMIELIQPYVNRYGEWLDLAANSGGVVIGGLLGRGLYGFGLPLCQKNNCHHYTS